MSKSSKWSLSSRFHIETLYETLLDTCYMPRQYHWMCKQVPQQTPAPTPKKKSTERKGKERKGKERKGKERKSADTVGFIIDTCKDSPVAASCQSHIIPRCWLPLLLLLLLSLETSWRSRPAVTTLLLYFVFGRFRFRISGRKRPYRLITFPALLATGCNNTTASFHILCCHPVCRNCSLWVMTAFSAEGHITRPRLNSGSRLSGLEPTSSLHSWVHFDYTSGSCGQSQRASCRSHLIRGHFRNVIGSTVI